MKEIINQTRQSRNLMVDILDKYPIELLNRIPDGFNNNLFWNYAHVVVTQQLLCYKLAGIEMIISEDWIREFRKGTKPERSYNTNELQELKLLSNDLLQKFESDISKGIFTEYQEYSTSFGVTLRDIQSAITFNAMHEALHLGYMLALQRIL